MPFNVGENVGPYRIIEQFGQGGMATVFKAYHASLDRYVALKVLHPAFNQDPNFEARFQREAKSAAPLQHRWRRCAGTGAAVRRAHSPGRGAR